MNHRIFERTLRLSHREACLSERRRIYIGLACVGLHPLLFLGGRRLNRIGLSADEPSGRPWVTGPSNHQTSDQVGSPPELKHINKARNRNQQGFPQ